MSILVPHHLLTGPNYRRLSLLRVQFQLIMNNISNCKNIWTMCAKIKLDSDEGIKFEIQVKFEAANMQREYCPNTCYLLVTRENINESHTYLDSFYLSRTPISPSQTLASCTNMHLLYAWLVTSVARNN